MRNISIILKEMALINNNKFIKEEHKPALLQKLQAELDHATGQTHLELAEKAPNEAHKEQTLGASPQPPNTVLKEAGKPAKT